MRQCPGHKVSAQARGCRHGGARTAHKPWPAPALPWWHTGTEVTTARVRPWSHTGAFGTALPPAPALKHPFERDNSHRLSWGEAANVKTIHEGEVEIFHRNLLCVENWVSDEMKASVKSASSFPAVLIFHQKIKEKNTLSQFLSHFFFLFQLLLATGYKRYFGSLPLFLRFQIFSFLLKIRDPARGTQAAGEPPAALAPCSPHPGQHRAAVPTLSTFTFYTWISLPMGCCWPRGHLRAAHFLSSALSITRGNSEIRSAN